MSTDKPTLTLTPGPTFRHTVAIPRPGAEPAPIVFEFRHRTRSELSSFIETLRDGTKQDEDLMMDLLVDWEGPDEKFSRETVTLLCENYPLAPRAVWDGYLSAYADAKRKN